jgi:hypothetical protein
VSHDNRPTVPWYPLVLSEMPGYLVQLMLRAGELVDKCPGITAGVIVDVLLAEDEIGLCWDDYADTVQMAMGLGIIEGRVRKGKGN